MTHGSEQLDDGARRDGAAIHEWIVLISANHLEVAADGVRGQAQHTRVRRQPGQ
jgi:hypothetical protein